MAPYDEARRRAMEDATLLLSLSEVPGAKLENALPRQDGLWILSAYQERQLADDFAFIASTSDDPNQVKAVAVEENPDGRGLTVRIAANSGNLVRTVQGLQTIVNIMHQARRRGRNSGAQLKAYMLNRNSIAKIGRQRTVARCRI